MNGYYLILEIFLRPVIIIIALVASVVILSAEVRILNQIWSVVTTNVAGHDPTPNVAAGAGETGSIEFFRTPIDQFFYLVIYTIVVYMMSVSSFKLIDLIPNSILRWIGSSVKTTSDYMEDPANSLVRYAYMGSRLGVNKASSSLDKLFSRN